MSDRKLKIVVLISGRGTNLNSLIVNQKSYEILAVISNKSKAPGLQYAKNANIPQYIFAKRDYDSIAEQQSAMIARLKLINPDYICLAGFLQILIPEFVSAFMGKIINIHPSLLPKLEGYYGLQTHQAALDFSFKEHGCSVGFVDHGVDTGPIIAQVSLDVDKSNTAEILAQRVLDLELKLYPWVMNFIATGDIWLAGQQVNYSEHAKSAAKINNYIIGDDNGAS
jgi:phosphoribosylglycinamide formyltransferase-1